MRKFRYKKQLVIGIAIIGVIILLNRYSILFDFILGVLLFLITLLVIAGLLSKTNALDKFRIIKNKFLKKVVR